MALFRNRREWMSTTQGRGWQALVAARIIGVMCLWASVTRWKPSRAVQEDCAAGPWIMAIFSGCQNGAAIRSERLAGMAWGDVCRPGMLLAEAQLNGGGSAELYDEARGDERSSRDEAFNTNRLESDDSEFDLEGASFAKIRDGTKFPVYRSSRRNYNSEKKKKKQYKDIAKGRVAEYTVRQTDKALYFQEPPALVPDLARTTNAVLDSALNFVENPAMALQATGLGNFGNRQYRPPLSRSPWGSLRYSNNGLLARGPYGDDFSSICCADCPDGNIQCLSVCVRTGCNRVDTCANAGDGAYASFCQRRCKIILGMESNSAVSFLPDQACRGFCAGNVQRLCAATSCRDHGCYAPECGKLAPRGCE